MSYIIVDVESDGSIPPNNSMVCFGAVIVRPGLKDTFYGKTKPISTKWDPQALSISGISREEHLTFPEPIDTMHAFSEWVTKNSVGSPIFVSDNLAYDWLFIHWYFHTYLGKSPFGWSGRRLGDLYCGMVKDAKARWKHLRKTPHDHNPVNDCLGNAEALLAMQEMGLKIKLN